MHYNIQNISELLAAVTTLTGFPVLWKNAQCGTEKDLPISQNLHTNHFCAKVKQKKRYFKKCMLNVTQLHRQLSYHHKKSFMCKCHAGVTELVIPLFKDEVFIGTIILGPMRLPRGKNIYPELQNEYKNLPKYNKQTLKSAEKILDLVEFFIIERMRVLLLRDLNKSNIDSRIKRAIEYINAKDSRDISACKLAKICGLSYSRFVHLFKEQANISFSDYVVWRRIEEAKLLLRESSLDIYDIAAKCNFASQSYFGSVFKKLTGMSPGKYRKRYCIKLEP